MFLMYSLIFGACAAVIPIVVHLLHRQRSTPVQWGAMQFLLDTTIQRRKRKNIDHWLLMLMRMAVIIFMALLLARPLLPTSAPNPFATTASNDIVIVLDHSLSMGRRSGERTLFDQGADVVDRVIDSLHPTDSLAIVLAEHSPRAFTEHPVSNAASNAKEQFTQLRQALRQVRPGETDASIAQAVQMAKDLANSGRNVHKIVLVLTDEQRSNWQTGEDAPWRAALGDRENGPDRDLAVYTLAVPPGGIVGSSANVAIANLSITPDVIGVNRVFSIAATVTNNGPGDLPNGAPVQLYVDGKSSSNQRVGALPAGESSTVHFDHVLTEPGSHWVKLTADLVDGLDADNSAYAALDAIDRLPVLVIDGDLGGTEGFRASRFLATALTPVETGVGGALISTKIVTPTGAAGETLDSYSVIIMNDVPRLSTDLTLKISDYVQSGHGLWIILGPRADTGYLADVLGKTPLLPLAVKSRQALKGNDVAAVETKILDHPIVSMMVATQGSGNAFTGTGVYSWWETEPALSPDSAATNLRTLLAVNHGDVSQPLVTLHDVGKSGGRVMIWTTSVDANWNNFPLVTNFLPLVQESVLYLSSGAGTGKRVRRDAGEPFDWSMNATATPITEIQITGPDGTAKKVQPMLTNGKYVLSYKDTRLPGLYAMNFEPKSIPQPVYFTVNIDKAELDPSTLTDSDIEWFKTHKYVTDRIKLEGLDKALGTENRGMELWPFAAVILLCLLGVEIVLTWIVAARQEGAAVT